VDSSGSTDGRRDTGSSDRAGPDGGSVDTVLLDVDGTLIDSGYLHALAWQRAFAAHGLTPPWWRVHRAIGMGGDLLVREVCGSEVEDALGDRLRDEWAERYREVLPEVRAIPGASDLVRALTRSGYRVAIASSGAREFTDAALERLGLASTDVDVVTSADDADNSKPAPDLLTVALRRAGGSSAVLVGDSVWDVAAATAAGMSCVAVRTGGTAAAELLDAGAVRVVDDVAVLLDTRWRP
jgi:HAD superfamily hydrolase (TIGR01549 family)